MMCNLQKMAWKAVGILALLPMFSALSFGQISSGSIAGQVQDSSGAAIAGASVLVTRTSTGVATPAVTNSQGFFEVPGLLPGVYGIKVTKSGFRELDFQGIRIDPGQRISRNLTLQVGKVSQTVRVSAGATQLDTSTGEVSGTIPSNVISKIDVNGHNYQSFLALVPGLNNMNAGAQMSGLGLNNSFVISSNGLAANQNVSMVDGSFNMNTGSEQGGSVNPELNTIGEIRVLTDNYSAKYGYAGGAQFLLELKSGQREFHGEAQEFIRNDAFDARNYFASSVSPLKQNIFGYTIGGPVIIPRLYNPTDRKVFFFWGQNWRVIHQGLVLRGATPTSEMRAGNFQEEAARLGKDIIDPDTGLPFPDNTIPASRISPSATALLGYLFPLPNNPSGGFLNYINDAPDRQRQQQEVLRLDAQFTKNFHVQFHYIQEDVYDTRNSMQFGGGPFTTIGSKLNTFGKNGYIEFTNILSPTAVNQFGFSYTQTVVSGHPTGNAFLPADLSLPGFFPNANPQRWVPDLSFSQGYSAVGVGVMNSLISAPNLNYTFTDNFSKVFHTHSISAGLFYNIGAAAQDLGASIQGNYSFTGVYTNDAIADFLLGKAASYGQASQMRRGQLRYTQIEPYIQDNWKVSNRLTVNLGLRYSYIPPWSLQQPVTTFVPSFFDPTKVPEVTLAGVLIPTPTYDPTNGLAYAGEREQGLTPGFSKIQEDLFQPRVGFAWDILGNQKAVLRGGFGTVYWRTQDQIWGTLSNPPFTNTVSLNSVPLGNPSGGSANPLRPPAITMVPLDAVPMRVNSFSIGLGQQLTANTTWSVTYAGNRATHMPWTRDFNQVKASGGFDFDPRLNANSISVNAIRPYLGYAGLSGNFMDGSGNYNSLQAQLQRRFVDNLLVQVAYTYSRALGKGSAYGGSPQNIYNLGTEYGLAGTDRTHMLHAAYVYSLPFYENQTGLPARFLGGWGLSGIFVLDSGVPLNVGLSTGTSGLAKRPDRVGSLGGSGTGTQHEWFNTSAFAAPVAGFFGNSGITPVRQPHLVDWDLTLLKRTQLYKERVNAEFRASFYNVLNHTNFVGVSTGLGSGNFGQLTSARDPRIMEFGLKITY